MTAVATLRLTLALAALVGIAVTLAAPSPAAAVVYKASISGQQQLDWSVDGTTGSCEIRRGTGSGTVAFAIKTEKPSPITVLRQGKKLYVGGSIANVVGDGSIQGSFTDTLATPCPGFEPDGPYTEPASDCGPMQFPLRVDLTAVGAFIYITGPRVPTGPIPSNCPYFSSYTESSDRRACGDGDALHKSSFGVTEVFGQGLLASRIQANRKKLLKPKKKVTKLTGRQAIECTLPSFPYSGGVKITGSLQYTLKLRKSR